MMSKFTTMLALPLKSYWIIALAPIHLELLQSWVPIPRTKPYPMDWLGTGRWIIMSPETPNHLLILREILILAPPIMELTQLAWIALWLESLATAVALMARMTMLVLLIARL